MSTDQYWRLRQQQAKIFQRDLRARDMVGEGAGNAFMKLGQAVEKQSVLRFLEENNAESRALCTLGKEKEDNE